jgi:hypothetical protein
MAFPIDLNIPHNHQRHNLAPTIRFGPLVR